MLRQIRNIFERQQQTSTWKKQTQAAKGKRGPPHIPFRTQSSTPALENKTKKDQTKKEHTQKKTTKKLKRTLAVGKGKTHTHTRSTHTYISIRIFPPIKFRTENEPTNLLQVLIGKEKFFYLFLYSCSLRIHIPFCCKGIIGR